MALFNRQKNSNVPMELQPYYDAPRSGPRGWLMWVVRIVALIIIVALLVIAARWGWQKIDNNDNKVGSSISESAKSKTKSTTSSSNNKAATNSSNKGTVKPSDDSASTNSTSTPASSTATTQPAAASTPSTSPATTPAALANTGPGQTIAVFGFVTIAATICYQSYLRFKQRLNA